MAFIKVKDGTEIFYKDWGKGQPILFHHGWPLTSDEWDAQMLFFLEQGYRVIAHDRRGHGRSTQTDVGNDMDTYSDDVAALVDQLDLRDVIHVGHSTGGGEVARYLGRHGTGRATRAVLVSAVTPVMVQSPKNPGGTPLKVFDEFRALHARNRAQFFLDLATGPFYGFNRPGAKVSEGIIRNWWRQSMMCGTKATYDCIKVFSESDMTTDLGKIGIPVLFMHSEDDQIVPFADSAPLAAKLAPKAILKVYKDFPHGMPTTHPETVNAEILTFLRDRSLTAAPAPAAAKQGNGNGGPRATR